MTSDLVLRIDKTQTSGKMGKNKEVNAVFFSITCNHGNAICCSVEDGTAVPILLPADCSLITNCL